MKSNNRLMILAALAMSVGGGFPLVSPAVDRAPELGPKSGEIKIKPSRFRQGSPGNKGGRHQPHQGAKEMERRARKMREKQNVCCSGLAWGDE